MAGPRFQFSIRRLFAVTTVVAATVGALAAEPGLVSGATLILLAAAFPAVYAAGLIGKSGCWKAFCAGAIIPAGIAFKETMEILYKASIWVDALTGKYPGVRSELGNAETVLELRTYAALFWIAMPPVGLMSAGFYRLARLNSPQGPERKPSRASLIRLATFCLVLIAIAVGTLGAERNRYSGSAMILIACIFVAALAAGIVGSHRAAKAFCAGAILPAGIALDMTVGNLYSLDKLEEIPKMFEAIEQVTADTELKPFIGLFWALAAIMGLASAGAYWAFAGDSPEES